MVFGEKTPEKFEKAKNNLHKIDITMYIPQIAMLIIAFVLGVYIPRFLDVTIASVIIG